VAKEKEKKVRKNEQSTLTPTALYLSDGPLSGDKLILEIRGHFLCLFTCSLHTVISLKHTHTHAYALQLLTQLHLQRG